MMRAKGVLRWDRICSVALIMKECMDSEYVHQDLRQHMRENYQELRRRVFLRLHFTNKYMYRDIKNAKRYHR